jgi:hypothetical protein
MAAAGMAMASMGALSENAEQAVHETCLKNPRGTPGESHWTLKGGRDIGTATGSFTPLHTMRLGMATSVFGLVVWGRTPHPRAGGT